MAMPSFPSLSVAFPRRYSPRQLITEIDTWRWMSRTGLLLGLLGASAGCRSDGLAPGKQVDRGELYWKLELNHHAVTMGLGDPYDTLTLVGTPRTVDGTPLAGFPAVQYSSSDPEQVAVTADGVLRAVAPTAAGAVIPVVARLTAGNLKHVDTVRVRVIAADPPPVLVSLSVRPVPPDSAKIPVGAGSGGTCFAVPVWTGVPYSCRILLPVRVLDAHGASIAGVPIAFRSSDPKIAYVGNDLGPGVTMGRVAVGPDGRPGQQATMYASTTVFGRTAADTVQFRLGWPLRYSILASSRIPPFPPELKVGVGALVVWSWQASTDTSAVDVTFVDPTNVAAPGPDQNYWGPDDYFDICVFYSGGCDAGNVMLRPSAATFNSAKVMRRFPVPGVYDYYSSVLGGAVGRIIVVDER